MANALYGKGRQAFLEGLITILTVNVKIAFIDDADYTKSIDTHDFLDDVPAGARVATSSALTTKSSTLGVFDADDVVVTAVSGDVFEQIIMYNDSPSTDATKHLIANIDTAVGLPFTPTGNNVTVSWDNGANKIFKL